MKQITLKTLLLTALCAVMAGCSKETDYTKPEYKKQVIINEYKIRFNDYVGIPISPLQNWGFGTSLQSQRAAITRGRSSHYFLADTYIKEYTQDYYDAALARLPEKKHVASDIIQNYEFEQRGPFRFDLFFTYTKQDSLEIGYYYYDPRTQTAADRQEFPLISSLAKEFADSAFYQYTFYSIPTPDQWLTPKISNGYNIWKIETKVQKVHARMFTIEEKDVPVDCYVGFYVKNNGRKYYTNKYLNDADGPFFAVLNEDAGILANSYVVGMEDLAPNAQDYDCNDVMLAVHRDIEVNPDTWPLLVTPKEPAQWTRIIAEDLNVHDGNSDFDFNDIVLDVKLLPTGAQCRLMAAGATLPIRINGDDALEVHKLFGVDQKVMVNTHAEKKSLPAAEREPVEFFIPGTFTDANDIQIEVNRGISGEPLWITLFAERAEAACKIAVDTIFVWPDERESIKDKYPLFPDWVADPSVKWY